MTSSKPTKDLELPDTKVFLVIPKKDYQEQKEEEEGNNMNQFRYREIVWLR